MRRMFAGAGLLLSLFLNLNSWGAPIKVSSRSSLAFPIGAPGDSPFIIPPGTSENSTNASFRVTGNANQAFTIALPFSATMNYKRSNITDSILIHSFSSYPQNSGVLDNNGLSYIFVGATRDSLRMNQTAGSYSGNFSLTVVY